MFSGRVITQTGLRSLHLSFDVFVCVCLPYLIRAAIHIHVSYQGYNTDLGSMHLPLDAFDVSVWPVSDFAVL